MSAILGMNPPPVFAGSPQAIDPRGKNSQRDPFSAGTSVNPIPSILLEFLERGPDKSRQVGRTSAGDEVWPYHFSATVDDEAINPRLCGIGSAFN